MRRVTSSRKGYQDTEPQTQPKIFIESCKIDLIIKKDVPMTFLLATILSKSMRTAMRWRKSPMSWKMSIEPVYYFNSNRHIKQFKRSITFSHVPHCN